MCSVVYVSRGDIAIPVRAVSTDLVFFFSFFSAARLCDGGD